MTGRNNWFVKMNQAMKNKVKFIDDITLATNGIGNVSIRIENSKHSLISNVCHIPGIKCNRLSIWKFLENNYNIHME